MSKKKPSGLSKKIPAIFEGIPDIDGPKPSAAVSAEVQPSLQAGLQAQARTELLLEISTGLVKALLVKKTGGRRDVLKFGKFPLAEPGQLKKDEGFSGLRAKIEKIYQDFRISRKTPVRILLRDRFAFIAEIDKPDAPAREMQNAILFQLAEKIPFSAEAPRLLFEEKDQYLRVGILKSETADKILGVFHQLAVYPETLTLMPFVYESFNRQHLFLTAPNALLVHIGEDQTSLMVFRKGEVGFVREIAVGDENITQAITGRLMVDDQPLEIRFEEAAALKAEIGLPTPDLMPHEGEPKLSQLAARMRPLFEKMVGEIKSTAAQHQRQFPADRIEEICLSGAGAAIKGLENYLAAQLRLPVKTLSLQGFYPELDLSYAPLPGLGLMRKDRFNFGGEEDLLKPKFEFLGRCLLTGSLLLTLFFGGLFAAGKVYLSSQQSKLILQQKKLDSLLPFREKIAALGESARETAARQAQIKTISPSPDVSSALKALSRTIPEAMRLVNVDYSKEPKPTLRLLGAVQSESPEVVLARFLEDLNRSAEFKNSILETSTAGEQNKKRVRFVVVTEVEVKE